MPNEKEVNENETALVVEEIEMRQLVIEKDQKIIELENKLVSMKSRSLGVHELNKSLMSSEQLTHKMALLDYEDRLMQRQMQKAKAYTAIYTKMNAAQIYVLMEAGREMGVTDIVALNMLYSVNGLINPYGDKMLGYILGNGYEVEYLDETKDSVTVRIYNDSEDYKETASTSDQIIIKSLQSGAAKFAKKNKLRFHAIRMIVSFHLPHLFMGCGDTFTMDFEEWKAGETSKVKDSAGNSVVVSSNEDIRVRLHQCKTIDELDDVYAGNKSVITKDITLASAHGKMREKLENI